MEIPTQTPLDVLRSVFGYEQFRGQQEAIIDHLVAGGDAMVLMPTGGGKSLCYQIPAIIRPGLGIVVSPLIALMQDQVAAMRELGVRAALLNSTLDLDGVRDVERLVLGGELDLLYVSPERLVTPRFLDLIRRVQIALFAIDEAHCVSQWGHDFRPEYRQVTLLHEQFPDVPRIALTATADEPTRRDIVERLDLTEARQFISGFDRPNIRYRVVPRDAPMQQLLRFIETEHAADSGIVYCMTRKKVEQVAENLAAAGHPALPYHAGLDASVRQRNQERFLREDRLIIVATIAFGMGIDKPDVRFVAHMELPKSLEAYYQETGRAGRDGLPANAWMAYAISDAVTQRSFIDRSEAPDQQKRIEHAKLNALLGYCETTRCRRNVLLGYFGEKHTEPCGNCDVCLDGVETWDGTVAAQKALSCVYRTEQVFGAAHLISVLLGEDGERIARFGHDQLSTFGIGTELDRKQWQSVFRQLVAAGVLSVDPQHGSLRLTESARPILRGEQSVTFRRDPARAKTRRRGERRSSATAALDAAAQVLFEALRHHRKELARQQDVPPYVIFHDATLLEMATQRPATLEAMAHIAGVGQRKLERYGDSFVQVIRDHAG